eukprot:5290725-Pleurochrysis_carterae.AAC.5
MHTCPSGSRIALLAPCNRSRAMFLSPCLTCPSGVQATRREQSSTCIGGGLAAGYTLLGVGGNVQ